MPYTLFVTTSLPTFRGHDVNRCGISVSYDWYHQWSRICLPVRSSSTVFNWVPVPQSFLCILQIIRTLYCLFFDLRLYLPPLISSNLSYKYLNELYFRCQCTIYRVFQRYLYHFIDCYEPKRTPRQIKRPLLYTQYRLSKYVVILAN